MCVTSKTAVRNVYVPHHLHPCPLQRWAGRDVMPAPPQSPPAIFPVPLIVLGCLNQANSVGAGLHKRYKVK